MKKIFQYGFLTIIVSLSFMTTVSGQRIQTLDLFHGRECPHCHRQIEWLPELQEMYPNLVINKYEVWHDPENQRLFQSRMKELGQQAGGVPTNIIGDTVFVGFDKESILQLMEENYGPPQTVLPSPSSQKEQNDISEESTNLESSTRVPWYQRLFKWLFGNGNEASASVTEEAPESFVNVGDKAPLFTAPTLTANNETINWNLSNTNTDWTLLFFYPKNFSYVCPTELLALVDKREKFEELSVTVVPISVDSTQSHKEWKPDVGGENFTFPWVADENGTIAQMYGVYDSVEEVALRGTFLIDHNGIIQFSMTTNSLVGRNIDEIIRIIEANKTGELCPVNWQQGEETLEGEPQK
jgi:peroxiredoxin (alkyl hydroperoxide reductase subunit C)